MTGQTISHYGTIDNLGECPEVQNIAPETAGSAIVVKGTPCGFSAKLHNDPNIVQGP